MPAAALEAEEKRAVERRRKEEEQIQQQEQVTAVYRQPEPVILEQRAAKPPRDVEDDWFIISDVSPKDSGTLTHNHKCTHVNTEIKIFIIHCVCFSALVSTTARSSC